MDEMRIRAGRTGPGKMRTAWVPAGLRRPRRDHLPLPAVPRERRGSRPARQLRGALLSDGSQACDAYAESRNGAVRHAGCRSHARREFERAKDSEPGLAAEALEPVGGLLLCERKIWKRKLEFRRSRALPVAEAFWKWCRRHCEDPRHLPKSPIAEAPDYVPDRRTRPEVWLSDPDVPIDTNHPKRGLRVLPLGGKNWLFRWTEVGA